MSPWERFYHYALRNGYVCPFHALFIYLIPGDVLPGDSKAIGIICALLNLSYPSYTHPRVDDFDDGEDLACGRGKSQTI